jgi:hypothetical protein
MSTDISTRSTEANAGARKVAAIFLIALLATYTVAVVLGWIPDGHKIDGVHFALIVLIGVIVVALIQPQVFDRLKRVKLSGFELEVLEKVREKQASQEDQLEDIRLILPLLLPEAARKHLFNLDLGNTSGYQGSHILRGELRRLRSMRLIRMKDEMQISQMKDGSTCDLAAFVELTPLGQRWVKRVREIEDAESPAGEGRAATI